MTLPRKELMRMTDAQISEELRRRAKPQCGSMGNIYHPDEALLREAASRLQAPAVAEVEAIIGTLPAVTIRSMETMPNGDAHLVSQAWVHEGCVIEIRGTNDKAIGWIDTHEWLFGSVYRHHLLPALRTGGSE